MELVLEQTQQGSSYEVSVSTEGVEELKRIVRIKGEKKEAPHSLRPTSNKLMFDESYTNVLERFYTSVGNPVKEILLKLNLPYHRLLKDGGEVKEPQERCIIKLFKITYQERYGHVSPEVTSSQDGKGHKMAKGDYAWLMISRCSRLIGAVDSRREVLHRNYIPPEVLLRVSRHLTWSTSEKAINSKPESFGYQSPMLMMECSFLLKIEIVVGGVSCCLELSVGEEDLLTLEVPALKNSSYKGPNRRSNSCYNEVVVSTEGETFCSWGAGPELS
ncbi:hypothetical protein Tco_0773273 [Tanacetum coccineum]|uniref:Uncharacterized protein n=1 Tax=Tanacetum coccineum TaxID=301880 RepID=A0ABQ4ZN93_9ASTR